MSSTSPPPSPPGTFTKNRNAATIFPGAYSRERTHETSLSEAYRLARGIFATTATSIGGLHAGYTLFWIHGESFGAQPLRCDGDSYVVVGRHTHADLVLDRDPTLALRHLLIRAIALPDGTAGLHALDLSTGIGVELSDGARPRAFFARGPVAMKLGAYALVALPNGFTAPETLPRADVDEAKSIPLGPYRTPAPEPQLSISGEKSSRVTLLPRVSIIGELPPAPEAAYGDRTLSLEHADKSARVTLSEAELDRGVIIGRSEKCFDRELRALLLEHGEVSRVHTLVLRERGEVFAYDLGSMHGTYTLSGRRIRRMPLTNAGATLALGNRSSAVRMHWHALH